MSAPTHRDKFIDFVRAASLCIVVTWHWAFTVLVWDKHGPHATNPIGFTSGMWLITWVFQVMPLFFFAGGWANASAWKRMSERGMTIWAFTRSRLRQLLLPAFFLIAIWWAILIGIGLLVDLSWLRGTVILILSPLWFAFTYALIIAVFPFWRWLHERFDYLTPLWLLGLAALVDIARFNYDIPYIAWLNMIIVWGLAHQLGFYYPVFTALPRRANWAAMYLGAFFLAALVLSDLYPGSMVGVPGEEFSNMAPQPLPS